MKVKVIIPASGIGERFGGKIPKQFLKIDNKEIIAHTLEKFHRIKLIDEIIISAKLENFVKISSVIKKHKLTKVKKIVEGGARRQDSVFNALLNLECKDDDLVLIHDSVRPFINPKKINKIISEAKNSDGVIFGIPVSETVKRADGKNNVSETVDRKNLWIIQTPQVFRYYVLKRSFDKANEENFTGTDEAAIVENAGYNVKIIPGDRENVKITVRDDLRKLY